MALCLPPQKLRINSLICLHALQDNLQDGGREQMFPMIKTISSSAAGEWLIYSVCEKLLQTLLIVKYFNNEFSNNFIYEVL